MSGQLRPWWPAALALLGPLLAALLGAGCDQRLRPGFPHRAHLASAHCGGPEQPPCPTCATCHDLLRTTEPRSRPSVEVCQGCHQENTPEVVASLRPSTAQVTPVRFSHPDHLGLGDIRGQCVGCHAGVTDDGRDPKSVFPGHDNCRSCHEDSFEQAACTHCHAPADLRRLVPQTLVRHDEAFLRDHATHASTSEKLCRQCHTEEQCARCHDQFQPLSAERRQTFDLITERIHRADFVARHHVDARMDPVSCMRCHTVSYCEGCHAERGVSAGLRDPANPHPIGWVGPDTGSPSFHGRAARRDIVSCAGCHDQGPATNCIRCHSVGGPGGNPHPGGWRSTQAMGEGVCRYCHEP